jgi:flagellar assembly protein FliH
MNLSSNQLPFPSSIQEFVYQNIPGASASGAPMDNSIFESESKTQAIEQPGQPNISEVEIKKLETAAYERGLAAGHDQVQAEANRAIAEAKEFVAQNLKSFEQERLSYYRRIEGDIVDLALAIARKVLHREAQVDRVVLAGVVRVALEKIAGSGKVTLHVHPSAARAWQDYLAEQTILATVPVVVEDGSLRPDQLVLKTDHGNTELGIEAQLKEIEKGFTDLVKQKQRSLKQ